MSRRRPPSSNDTADSIQATRVIQDPSGGARRQVREYLLSGGPEKVQVRVDVPRFSVGSHRGNDLVLDHPSVSRFHLEIEARAGGYWARDLDSTNGTLIDGLRVREARLPEAATVQLGEVSLSFSLTDSQADLPIKEEHLFHGVLGRSPAMREIFAQLERAAPSRATVLLGGESGTGKEMVAAALHRASDRAAGPFVVLDCAAIPQSLIESEFFGHERGAFTGAVARSEGRFVEAHGGTLFLDEIGELPLEMQPKLLRVLENRQVRPLGGTATREVDVRLVAATNRNLAREVNRGTFREDLYYRLAVVQVILPPLRERPEDLRLLVGHFIERSLVDDPARARQVITGISEENWRRLEGLPWPGNVRELRNFIERTLIMSDGGIETQHVPAPTLGPDGVDPGQPAAVVDLDRAFTELKAETVARFERAYLLGQLARHDSNVSAAARAAGLDRMNFKRLLKKYR